jgi:hypothetical protein
MHCSNEAALRRLDEDRVGKSALATACERIRRAATRCRDTWDVVKLIILLVK